MRTLPAALLAVCLSSCSSGDKSGPDGRADPDTAARHRDYFATWEQRYEIVAVMSLSQAWLQSTRSHAGLKNVSVAPVDDLASSKADLAERLLIEHEKEFVARHKVDAKDWKASFAKDYPEAAVVMREVEVASRELAQKQALDASGHLVLKYGEIVKEAAAEGKAREADDRYHAYQKDYVARNAAGWVEAAVPRAKKLKGFVDLRKKVLGK